MEAWFLIFLTLGSIKQSNTVPDPQVKKTKQHSRQELLSSAELRLISAGAPKLEPFKRIPWQSLARSPKLCNSDDTSMRDPHCEDMLSGRTSQVIDVAFITP